MMYHVPEQYWLKAKAGLKVVLSKLELEFNDNNCRLTGSRTIKETSIAQYESLYRGLRYFFCTRGQEPVWGFIAQQVGDYESLLMLQTNSPDNCPSINANSIALFIKWKRNKKGTPLLLPNDTVALDVLGKEVKCMGGRNNPNNVKQFLSAISVIHRANDQRGHIFKDVKLVLH
jgi:hypothetical protein